MPRVISDKRSYAARYDMIACAITVKIQIYKIVAARSFARMVGLIDACGQIDCAYVQVFFCAAVLFFT